MASTYCPYETITYGYYFVRPKGYDPKAFDGIVPKDYYTLPTSHCQVHTKEWYDAQNQETDDEDQDNENDSRQNKTNGHNKTNRQNKSGDQRKTQRQSQSGRRR